MIDWNEIVAVVRQRQSRDTVLKTQMIDIRDKANGDWVIPLTDIQGGTAMPAPTAAFIADAIDATAMRAASQNPMIEAPPVDPTKIRSRDLARIRRHAWYGCWQHSKVQLATRRAFRQIAAYGVASALVEPDLAAGRARIRLRDPLTAYPAEFVPEDLDGLTDVAWTFGVHPKTMIARWPQTERLINRSRYTDSDGLWDFVEWMDRDQIVIGVLGPRYGDMTSSPGYVPADIWRESMLLTQAPNRAGVVTAVAPIRVTLDRVAGQVAAVSGLVEIFARMTALDIIATEKSIFPDRYVVGRETQKPVLVGGDWKDGRTGQINLLQNVDKIGELTSTVGPNTHPMIDRIERAIRLSSGHVPAFGGETFGSLRTGQGIDRMGAFAVDPRIQELHEIWAEALTCLNRGVAAVEKGWFSGRKIVAFAGRGPSSGTVEYQPEKIWESDENRVEYPMPGSDAPGAETRVISARSAGLMSVPTAMAKHPLIDDPEFEHEQVMLDRIDEATLTGIVQQVAQGTFPLPDVVKLRRYVVETHDLAEAMERVHREAQQRQAQQAPEAPPGMAQAPETQPGVSMPGMGMEQQAAPAPGPPVPATDRMRMALQALAARGGGQ